MMACCDRRRNIVFAGSEKRESTGRVSVLIVMLGTLLVLACVSCNKESLPLDEQLRMALAAELDKHHIRGASVAVVFPDESMVLAVAGYSHDTVSIHPDMLFAIGSITKNVEAALILKLAEEGVLDLEDPLHKWLPSFPFVDSTITIRQLLNHTSGLYMFWDNQRIWDDLKQYRDSIFTPETVLSYLKAPYFPPGKGYHYSNTNYLLLAMIITRATKASLSEEFRRRFWSPLGIGNTFLSMEEELPPKLAHVWSDNFDNDGSNRDVTFLPRNSHESITYGSSGLFMTAGDLAMWSHKLFGGEVLSPSSLWQMLDFGQGGYGLGTGDFGSGLGGRTRAVGHMGGNIGTTAAMLYSRKYGISLAVMINSYDVKAVSRISGKLGKIILRTL
jgi:D-alanyl-D-alanine carboxypeptidase